VAEDQNENSAQTIATSEKRQINRNKRRNKLIIDEVKEIDSNAMKSQLSDTRGILGTLELAPPTRKLMLWKETGGVDKLYAMPCRQIQSRTILRLYSKNMITKSLADITNQNRSMYIAEANKSKNNNETLKEDLLSASKTIENYLNNQEAIEANMGDLQTSRNILPLADSFIDNQNDVSKRVLNSSSMNRMNGVSNVDFETDNNDFGSMNNQSNMDDILEPQVNLEVTPSKDNSSKLKKNDLDIDSDEADEEGESPSNRNKSPKQKRSYRKSMTAKDATALKDELEQDLDETVVSNDPNKHLTKRAKAMISILNKSLTKYDNVGFTELIKKNPRKTVVQKFYSLLVLTKYEIIDVSQDETYGDIIISKGEKFDSFQAGIASQN
jgi:cohesin complex subunit SCC1